MYVRMLKTLLTSQNVAYATTIKKIFSGITITIKERDRIGFVGNNGVGKTTFLQLLAGTVKPDSGNVIKNGSVGYVPQIDKDVNASLTVEDLLESGHCSYSKFKTTYRKIFSSEVPQADLVMSAMSGGERTKVWIALVVSSKPAVLLLDEPTNHLDATSVRELERWIDTFSGAIVFVSHNRAFLSSIARVIWELENGAIAVYGGSYDDFLLKKQQDSAARSRDYEATKKELRQLTEGVHMREVRAARATTVRNNNKRQPSRDKFAEGFFRNRSEKGVGKLKIQHDAKREELGKKLSALSQNKKKTINLGLVAESRDGSLIIDTKELTVAVGTKVLIQNVQLRIGFGDRIAIQGDNGAGKTMLIKSLLREIENPTPGKARVGIAIKTAYIDQQYAVINLEQTVFENLERNLNVFDSERVYKQIGRYQFSEQYVHKKAKELSGGEMARLAFAIATITPLDLLVLDEPTNNVDIGTVAILVNALKDFQGSLVVISHDRAFLDELGIQQSFIIKEQALVRA